MGLLIYFSLIVTNLFVLTSGYEDRLQSYQTARRENEDEIRQVKKYSEFGQIGQNRRLKCNRKPKLLSIFNEGVDKRKGNSVAVAHGEVPAVAEQHGSDNPYLNIFSSIDFTVVCQVVMSLLALLFAYDAISREKEAGTLRLALSCAVPRPTLLLGKYIAGIVSISLPLVASFVGGLLVVQLSPYVSFSSSDWVAGIVNFPRIYALRLPLFSDWTFPFRSDTPLLYYTDVCNVCLGVFRADRSKFNGFMGGTCESDSIGTIA